MLSINELLVLVTLEGRDKNGVQDARKSAFCGGKTSPFFAAGGAGGGVAGLGCNRVHFLAS